MGTGSKREERYLASWCCAELVIDKMGRSGTSFLCVLGRPYMRARREPVGRIRSYKFAGSKSSLCNCSRRRCIRDSIFEVLSFSLDGLSVRNFVSSAGMEFVLLVGFVQNILLVGFVQNKTDYIKKNELHSCRRNEISDTRPIK